MIKADAVFISALVTPAGLRIVQRVFILGRRAMDEKAWNYLKKNFSA